MESSFRIGEWLVEPLHNRLVRGDTRVKLDPKVMRVLLYLTERPSEVAEKEKIIESVWDGTFVTDEVLTNAIFELRKGLGDDAKEPRFIQTVPRKGYRLLLPVEAATGASRSPRKAWVAVVCLGIAAIAGWYLSRTETEAPPPRVTPLTGFDGAEWWPALSPDGERVAYVWDGGKPGAFDLYAQMVGGGDPLRLTEAGAHAYSPVWSPDGAEIAFLREATHGSDVLIIPALGGLERQLATINNGGDSPGRGWNPGMAWSPDGRFLAVVDLETSAEPQAIFLLSLESGEKRRVTSPPANTGGDHLPAFSSDGKTLAFARSTGIIQGQIYLQSLEGGEPRLLTTDEGWITDLDWTADGGAIIYASGTESQTGTTLWRVPVDAGVTERVPFGELAQTISIAPKGTRLVYDRRSWFNSDLWRIDGSDASERSSPTRLIGSSRVDWAHEYSPDGTKVALASERSGNNNIWVCGSDGTDCFQLTHMARALHPRWSPDGKHLVFHGREGTKRGSHLYVVELEGGFTRRVTQGDARDFYASWSHDGRSIYFTSVRTGELQVWKASAEGGDAAQITQNGGFNPRESADGRFLYYADSGTIRRVSVNGGEELPILGENDVVPTIWTLWDGKIVYVKADLPFSHLETFDLETGQVKRIFSTELGLWEGLTVSPDGRWILLSIDEPPASDIMLVEGFR